MPANRSCLGLLVLALVIPGGRGIAGEADRLILGVHPYLSPPELHARFRPLARYLGRHLQIPVSIRIGRDCPSPITTRRL